MSERPGTAPDTAFPALLEDDIVDLYDEAPGGHVSTLLDGTIAKVNGTLLGWLGYTREELVGRRKFSDLLTVGGRIYHETHVAPLLRMQGAVSGIALELRTADDGRLPVLVSSGVKTGGGGEPLLVRSTILHARDRRAYEQELLRARRDADRERDRLRGLVAELQRSLLPAELPVPPGMTTAGHYRMASPDVVGGDFYDLFPLDDGRWGAFLGDVCGKGVEAAAVTAAARYTLRAAAVYHPDPAAVLSNLNSVLFQDYRSLAHRHCTVTFGILTPDGPGWTATIAAGGHPPPLLIRADGSAAYQHTLGGTLIGIVPEPRLVTRTVRLAPGDTLLFYSDGLTEGRVTADGPRFGEEGLLAYAGSLGPTTAEGAVTACAELLDGFAGIDDDVAVMAVGVAV